MMEVSAYIMPNLVSIGEPIPWSFNSINRRQTNEKLWESQGKTDFKPAFDFVVKDKKNLHSNGVDFSTYTFESPLICQYKTIAGTLRIKQIVSAGFGKDGKEITTCIPTRVRIWTIRVYCTNSRFLPPGDRLNIAGKSYRDIIYFDQENFQSDLLVLDKIIMINRQRTMELYTSEL